MTRNSRLLWRMIPFVALVSVACSSTAVDESKKTSPAVVTTISQPVAQQEPTPFGSASSPLTAVFCPDISSSYPRPLLQRAKSTLADNIERLLKPGSPGATLYIRTIKENSYSWDAELMPTISIPAVPGDPLPPVLPTEPILSNENPFARKAEEKKYLEERAIWEAEISRLQGEYQKKKTAQETAIAQARDQLKKQTDELRQIDPPPASGSDIWGCVQKGSELFPKDSSAKYLIIASDLDEFGPQEKATLSLAGVKTRIVFFYCDQAQQCEERRRSWSEALRSAGATHIKFYSPEEKIDDIFY